MVDDALAVTPYKARCYRRVDGIAELREQLESVRAPAEAAGAERGRAPAEAGGEALRERSQLGRLHRLGVLALDVVGCLAAHIVWPELPLGLDELRVEVGTELGGRAQLGEHAGCLVILDDLLAQKVRGDGAVAVEQG